MMKVEVGKVYDTLWSSPGMNEIIKVDLRISRKTVLLLSEVMKKGMNPSSLPEENGILEVAGQSSLQELQELMDTCLEKASLKELNHKLQSLIK